MMKTKQVACIYCGEIMTVSMYASAKTAKCDKCKKSGKQADKPLIQDAALQKMVDSAMGQGVPAALVPDTKMDGGVDANQLSGVNMDEYIHINEHQEALANAEPDPLKYITLDEHREIVSAFKNGTAVEDMPLKVLLQRNRSEIEGHVIYESGVVVSRVPTEYKPIVNELDYLSVSKINTYQQCPALFHELYMNKTDPSEDNGNIFTWFGTILHEVADRMEKIYTDTGMVISPLPLYDEAWKKQELTDFGMYKEGRELIHEYFLRNPINLKSDRKIATEYEFRGQVGDALFGCMFDYVGELDHRTGIIKDYKSNRRPYTTYELEDSVQLSVYEVIARKLWPQYENWVTGYEMFRFGWQQCPPRSTETLIATENYINNIWHQIMNDNMWREKINDLCPYCNRRMKCKKYNEVIANPKIAMQFVATTQNIEEIEASRKLLGSYEKIIKSRKDELAEMVKRGIENAARNNETFVVGGKQLFLQAQSRPFYDYHATRDTMTIHGKAHLLADCSSINKTKMDKIAKDNPALALELSKCLVQTYSAPYIMERKVND